MLTAWLQSAAPAPIPGPQGGASLPALKEGYNLLPGDPCPVPPTPTPKLGLCLTTHIQEWGVTLQSWQWRVQNPPETLAPFPKSSGRTTALVLEPQTHFWNSPEGAIAHAQLKNWVLWRARLQHVVWPSPPDEPMNESRPCWAQMSIAGDCSKGGETLSYPLIFSSSFLFFLPLSSLFFYSKQYCSLC